MCVLFHSQVKTISGLSEMQLGHGTAATSSYDHKND